MAGFRSFYPDEYVDSSYGIDYDALYGLDIGADDYLVKPFNPVTLGAKVKALIRRSRGNSLGETLTCGPISLDLSKRACAVYGQNTPLPPREYALLECFLRNQGRVLSRSELLDKVWGIDFEGEERAVDVQVKNLRASLGSAGRQIETVFKAGYRMKEGAS